MLSDLSPGDKLSLKGKLFELQKKLEAIDSHQKANENCSFRPQLIANYEIAHREKNFIDNVQKSEMMKQQKLQALRDSLLKSDECSFAPKTNANIRPKSKNNAASEKPVFERLSQKGVEYSKAREEKSTYYRHHDSNGTKLFQPRLSKSSLDIISSVEASNSISAPEYLYRDAKDRREKLKERSKMAQKEVEDCANSKKISAQSQLLLKKKYERELQSIFEAIDVEKCGYLSFDDIQRECLRHSRSGNVPSELVAKYTDELWNSLDLSKNGIIYPKEFTSVLLPLLLRGFLHTFSWKAWKQSLTMTSSDSGSTGDGYEDRRSNSNNSHPNNINNINNINNNNNNLNKNSPGLMSIPSHRTSPGLSLSLSTISGGDALELVNEFNPEVEQDHGTSRKKSRDQDSEDENENEDEDNDNENDDRSNRVLSQRALFAHNMESSDGIRPNVIVRNPPLMNNNRPSKLNNAPDFVEGQLLHVFFQNCWLEMEAQPGNRSGIPSQKTGDKQGVSKVPGRTMSNPSNRKTANDINKPKINAKSRLLAKKKEDRDRQLLAHYKEGNIDIIVASSSSSSTTTNTTTNTTNTSAPSRPDSPSSPPPPPPPPPSEQASPTMVTSEVTSSCPETAVNNDKKSAKKAAELTSTELLYARRSLIETKIAMQRKEKEDKERLECSFRPQIIDYDRIKSRQIKKKPETLKQRESGTVGLHEETLSISTSNPNQDDGDRLNRRSHSPSKTAAQALKKAKESVFDRLNRKTEEARRGISANPAPFSLEQQELLECTFAPSIPRCPKHLRESSSTSPNWASALTTTGGVKTTVSSLKSVERMRRGRELREDQKLRLENLGNFNEERYQKSRYLASKGPVPFHLHTGDRSEARRLKPGGEQEHEANGDSSSNPRSVKAKLFVDIKLGPSKVVQIPVNDHDDPVQVAFSFCRIYSLDDAACTVLAEAVRQSMVANGVKIGPLDPSSNMASEEDSNNEEIMDTKNPEDNPNSVENEDAMGLASTDEFDQHPSEQPVSTSTSSRYLYRYPYESSHGKAVVGSGDGRDHERHEIGDDDDDDEDAYGDDDDEEEEEDDVDYDEDGEDEDDLDDDDEEDEDEDYSDEEDDDEDEYGDEEGQDDKDYDSMDGNAINQVRSEENPYKRMNSQHHQLRSSSNFPSNHPSQSSTKNYHPHGKDKRKHLQQDGDRSKNPTTTTSQHSNNNSNSNNNNNNDDEEEEEEEGILVELSGDGLTSDFVMGNRPLDIDDDEKEKRKDKEEEEEEEEEEEGGIVASRAISLMKRSSIGASYSPTMNL